MPIPPFWNTLVTAAELLPLLPAGDASLLILDTRFDLRDRTAGLRAYEQAHLPGAYFLDLEQDLSGTPNGHNGRHPLPDRAAFAARLGALGVQPHTQVVLYDASGGMFAARAWWMLRWLGHSAVAVLDGGVSAWQMAGGSLDQSLALPRPAANFPLRAPLVPSLDHAALRAVLGHPGHQVVDARSPERFRGENETLDPVGGHIPGALNRCFQDNLVEGWFKPRAALREEWLAVLAGRSPAELIHQCGSGVTACHNLLALAAAGLDGGRLYPGSWSEWCAQPGAPVARTLLG